MAQTPSNDISVISLLLTLPPAMVYGQYQSIYIPFTLQSGKNFFDSSPNLFYPPWLHQSLH